MVTRSNAFTLLEVMIALAIIAIGLVVILHSHIMGVNLAGRSQGLSRASLLAQRRMEEIDMGEFPDMGEEEGIVDENYPGFSYRQIVSPVEFSGESLERLREVAVIVSWFDGFDEQRMEVVTYIAKGEED